ncbi:GspE/PulE family protein [Pseudaestuariivita rosea]|uniref:GspE/PulE family protein n=1 Tax=Pseudaestuariivita rosea TaxID=2763263 RepID=UPI001ABB2074|nr:GspE/PulE family protein [Pseudaestuariivita rosea]
MTLLPSFHDDDFARLLIEAQVISPSVAQRALAASKETGTGVEKSLLELGLATETDIYRHMAQYMKVPLIDIKDVSVDLADQLALSQEFLSRVSIIPVEDTNDAIVLATSDPHGSEAMQSISFHLNRPVRAVLAAPSTIQAALSGPEQDTTDVDAASSTDVQKLQALANDGPIIKLVNDLVTKAVEMRASDIHIEAMEQDSRVRFRIDGRLQVERRIADADRAAVASRLKVMAHLNISEKRRPQDGRAQISVRGRVVDLRLSTLPTQFGESIVLRILDRTRVALEWSSLGYPSQRVKEIEDILHQPNGIFLVVGPTGSGKTTTLYTGLSKINSEDRKIVTVEDPIEYALAGVNQVQVEPQIDMTFARALRAILRQDPDVVMVGEIRDQETAEIAVRAALVGRLVLSTVHTNDAVSAIDRLLDLGVPPFLLASTLRGVLSQRLVRKHCHDCGGAGCETCGQSGRKGRIVVSELLHIDGQLADAIAEGAKSNELRSLAAKTGFQPIENAARDLLKSGQAEQSDIVRAIGL